GLALAIVLTLGLVLGMAAAAQAQKPLKVRLGLHTAMMGAPDVMAIRQGYYKQEGLEVEWRRFALGKEGRDAMIAGAIDINATAPTPFLIGLEKGVPYTAVAVNSLFCGTNHIVVRKDADINSVAQLRGKKIGIPRGTITDYVFAARMAPAYGLKPGDYEVANIPDAKDRIPSLIAKAIDAAALTDPQVSIGEQDGMIRSIENFCKYDPQPFMLTVTNKILKENPDAVVAYLRGWLKGVNLLKAQPEKAAEVYAEEQKAMGRTVSVAVLDKALRRMRWEPEIDIKMERYLADQARDLAAGSGEGRLKAIPDIAKALNKEVLQKAKAGR
ncbi:MAG: ABC transporter substrate-binding protein, partial [candidate division NC10 bacterium]